MSDIPPSTVRPTDQEALAQFEYEPDWHDHLACMHLAEVERLVGLGSLHPDHPATLRVQLAQAHALTAQSLREGKRDRAIRSESDYDEEPF